MHIHSWKVKQLGYTEGAQIIAIVWTTKVSCPTYEIEIKDVMNSTCSLEGWNLTDVLVSITQSYDKQQ